MREIEFRGYSIDLKEWVYGDLIQDRRKKRAFIVDKKTEETWEVVPASVGQFTGFHDKNGRRIYEGDILKTWVGEETVRYCCGAFRLYLWDAGEYVRTDVIDINPCREICQKLNVEIAGNIYEKTLKEDKNEKDRS